MKASKFSGAQKAFEVMGWTAPAPRQVCDCGCRKPSLEEPPMSQEIAVIGLDLAKNVFQVHAIAHDGSPVVRRQLRRAEVLKFFAKLKQRRLVGMEACASAHYWGREIGVLDDEVQLMPPAHEKP